MARYIEIDVYSRDHADHKRDVVAAFHAEIFWPTKEEMADPERRMMSMEMVAFHGTAEEFGFPVPY